MEEKAKTILICTSTVLLNTVTLSDDEEARVKGKSSSKFLGKRFVQFLHM